MLNIKDDVAKLPMEEFAKLDPWYWNSAANKYYDIESSVSVLEASLRNKRKKDELKSGDIIKCNFHIPEHSKRPGLILILNGLKPLVCTICTNSHNPKYKKYTANVDIVDPILLPDNYLDPSHVATNRFRYVKDSKMDLYKKIGRVNNNNLKEITNQFIAENADPEQMEANDLATIYESIIDFQNLDYIMEDIENI